MIHEKHERHEKNARKSGVVSLVPKLQLGNAVLEAPASRLAKLELRSLGSQAGAWEPAQKKAVLLELSCFSCFSWTIL